MKLYLTDEERKVVIAALDNYEDDKANRLRTLRGPERRTAIDQHRTASELSDRIRCMT